MPCHPGNRAAIIRDPAREARRCLLGHKAEMFNKVVYEYNVGYQNHINKFIFIKKCTATSSSAFHLKVTLT